MPFKSAAGAHWLPFHISTCPVVAPVACPTADPLSVPALEAPSGVTLPPAPATYAFRDDGTFEVSVVWTDSVRPPPEDYFPRRVRYAVNCDEGTLTLAAVGLIDRAGQLQKRMMVPPGASDPVKPPKGGEQAKWIQRVCMF